MGCFRSSSFFAPAAGVSPAKRGEAQRSRERSDLDTPAAGYTVARERALARSRRPLRSLPRSFILTLRISFCLSDPKREPGLAHAALPAASPHIRSSFVARTIIPHARGRRARVGGTILFHGVFQPGGSIRGRRPPGSGEAVAFSFAGKGLSHQAIEPSGHRWSVGVGSSHRSGRLEHRALGNDALGDKAPQGDEQFARQRHDGDPADPSFRGADPRPKPAA